MSLNSVTTGGTLPPLGQVMDQEMSSRDPSPFALGLLPYLSWEGSED